MPLSYDQYERAAAVVAHETMMRSIALSYPEFSINQRRDMFCNILDRLARMNGFALRREWAFTEADDEE